MLVIISDLHLTDGSSGATIAPGAFQIFAERLGDLACSASWRVDGSYRPIPAIDLLLLGDVLDLIRCTGWLKSSGIRPWSGPQAPQTISLIKSLTAGVLEYNQAALGILRGLAAGSVCIPPANRLGQPAKEAAAQSVPVRLHYLVGNHDWFFHLPGPGYNQLRQAVVRSMGLSNRSDVPFPHEPAESPELLEVMRRHKVFARHGDIFDPFNFSGDRDASSLGDAIVIELLARFGNQVEAELGADLPAATTAGLRELDNVRPLILAPVWIEGLLERTCPSLAMRARVKRIWDRLADQFLALDFVRAHDSWCPFDIVDGLAGALKFSKRLSVGWASSIAGWWQRLCGSAAGSYCRHALAEQDFRNRRAKHIVYGHTHVAESVPLDASFAESYVLNQVYFNSGTWRRVHRQTEWAPAEHEFIAAESMTYLAFFQGDERAGRPYETWSGTLGINPAAMTAHRLDQGGQTHAAAQPHSAAGAVRRGPHFAASLIDLTDARPISPQRVS